MSEVAEKVKSIIAEHLGIDDLEKITNDAKFIDDDGKGMKRAIEAIAISMGAPTRIGAYLKISDALTGEHIHPDILSVQAVS